MVKSRKLSLVLSMLLAASLALSACSGSTSSETPKDTTSSTTQNQAKKPAVGGEINLRLASDPDTFNPIYSSTTYGSNVNGLVYASLFTFNTKWEPTPNLAKSWSASPDNLKVTIKLRDDVKFHDGTPLTADDVVFTLGALLSPDYTGARKSSAVGIKSITAPDPTTVEFNLEKPNAALFININYGIMSRKAFGNAAVKEIETHPASQKPVGAGPYRFKEFVKGQYVLLERNPDWFQSKELGGAPFIPTVRFKIIPDNQTGLAALENGEIDLDQPPSTDVTRLEKDYKGRLIPVNYERNGWGYMSFNVTRPHLDNKLVRQALTYALDRQSIIDSAFDGRAVIPAGPIPNVSWAYDSSIKAAPYDPKKAKALLEEAGYKLNSQNLYEKDGKPLKLTFYGTSGNSQIEVLATIAKKNWKDIGVDLDVQLMDFNAMQDNYTKPGKFDVSFGGMTLGLDPDSMYNLFHSSVGKPDAKGLVLGFNRMRFSNEAIDKAVEAGRAEFDQQKRKAIYSDFQKKLVDEAPVILVYANRYTDFHTPKIKGVVNYPGAGANQLPYFWNWYINEQ
ncbi:MAG TPA: ABC transporter substrate-binding protein [Symbiobacteriaceae bacterium]|nr:ABC transporter substrate-binding protein [Symbiobacteriaceae bacterium]